MRKKTGGGKILKGENVVAADLRAKMMIGEAVLLPGEQRTPLMSAQS